MTLPHELPKVVSELQSQRQQSVRKLRSIALDFIHGITEDALSTFHFLPLQTHLPSTLHLPSSSSRPPTAAAAAPAPSTRTRASKRKARATGLDDRNSRPTRRTRQATRSQTLHKPIVPDKENVDLAHAPMGKRTRKKRAPRPPLKPVPVNAETDLAQSLVDHRANHDQHHHTVRADEMSTQASLNRGSVTQMKGGPQVKQEKHQQSQGGDGETAQEQTCKIQEKEVQNAVDERPNTKKRQRRGRGRKRNRNDDEIVTIDPSQAPSFAQNNVLEVSGDDGHTLANENLLRGESGTRAVQKEELAQSQSRPSLDASEPESSLKDPLQGDSKQKSSEEEKPIAKRRVRRRLKGNQGAATSASDAPGIADKDSSAVGGKAGRETLLPLNRSKGFVEVDEDKSTSDKSAGSVDDTAEASKSSREASKSPRDEQLQYEADHCDVENVSTHSSAADLNKATVNREGKVKQVLGQGPVDSHQGKPRPALTSSDDEDDDLRDEQSAVEDTEDQDPAQSPEAEASLSPKLQTRDETRRTEPGEFPRTALFTVGKDGMIGKASIGALSQLASTPATEYKGRAEGEEGAEAAAYRRTRLFNPKTSIYPSSRKPPLLSSKKGLSSATRILQAPLSSNADPNTSVRLSTQVPATSRKCISFMDSISSNPQPQSSVTEDTITSWRANVENPRDSKYPERSLEFKERNSMELNSPGKRQTCGEMSTNSTALGMRRLAFNAVPNEAGSPPRDLTRMKTLLKEGPYPSLSRNNPKTAPGQRPFPPPTYRKLTKSAYRQRIERLHASAHASSSMAESLQDPLEGNSKISHIKGCTEAVAPPSKEIPSASIEAQELPAATNETGSEGAGDSTLRSSGQTEILIHGERKNITDDAAEEVLRPRPCVTERNISSDASSTGPSEKCENDMPNRVEEILRKSQKLSLERLTPHSSDHDVSGGREKNESNEEKLEVVENPRRRSSCNVGVDTNTPVKDQPGSSPKELNSPDMDTQTVSPLVPNPKTPNDEPSTASLTRTPQSSQDPPTTDVAMRTALDTAGSSEPMESAGRPTTGPSTNAFSNLVSSVASFLPVGSSLFGAQAESKAGEISAEDQAKLAAKRQKQDAERREAELIAKREAMRLARQKERQERQKKAESRRKLLAEMERHREVEKRKKEALRLKKRKEEEEKQRMKKEEEDKRKEEHRKRVLEQKQKRMMAAKQGARDGQHTTKLRRPGQTISRQGQPQGSKFKTLVSDALPPKTPKNSRPVRAEDEPQWELTAERTRGISENSEHERDRRRKKKVPQWAGSSQVWMSLTNENADPDTVFARGAPSCNLETVFQGTEGKRKFRPRDDSGDWTKDRLTAKEEMDYKRKAGFFENA